MPTIKNSIHVKRILAQLVSKRKNSTTVNLLSKLFFLESKWQDFDWETYIKKDITNVDLEDPTKRFTINLLNSINVGVNRTIPDYRYVMEKLNIY